MKCYEERATLARAPSRGRQEKSPAPLKLVPVLCSVLVSAGGIATTANAQAAKAQSHIAAAKAAAYEPGQDFTVLYDTVCAPALSERGPTLPAPQIAPPLATRRVPPRSEWYTDPAKVFDNLYFIGSPNDSTWAVTTSERAGAKAIRSLILKHLAGTIVTVVLIGLRTALSPWVQYEIQQSTARKNRLLGIYIHHLTDRLGFTTSRRGPTPLLPAGVEFPTYDWDEDVDRFRSAVDAAGRRADALRG